MKARTAATVFASTVGSIIAAALLYFAAIVFFLGTVPIPKSGWGQGPEVSREPVGGQWLGFRKGASRIEALSNACRLIERHDLYPADFQCLSDKNKRVGVTDDMPGSWSEAWTFYPKLNFWEYHCFGLHREKLNVFIKDGRIDGINVDCGVIDL